MTAGLSFFMTRPIDATPGNGYSKEDRFTVQADLVWKF
jgi:hypothetical protein